MESAMMVRKGVLVVLVMIALSYSIVAAECIVLVSSEDTKASPYGRWLDLIYSEVFRRLGYQFKYVGYPGGRAPIMAESGEVDGEIHRAAEYEKTAKNLMKVPEPSFSVKYIAYAVIPGIVLNGWGSLKDKNYAVEYRRGSQVPEAALTDVVRPEMLSKITTAEQGLEKLIMGRIDIYVDQELVVAETLKSLPRSRFDSLKVYQAGIMWTGESYVFLHKKHADLVLKIAEILKAMKQDGLITQYEERVASARQ
jgi:polar amino acid transport system substrate-binding protein